MILSKNLLRDVRILAREKEKSITPEQLFRSREYRDYVHDLAGSVFRPFGMPVPEIDLVDAGPGSFIGYTDGNTIHVNISNELASRYKDLLNQFMVNLGIKFHEFGHDIFHDFDADREQMNRILAGRLPGRDPETDTPEEEQHLQALRDALANPDTRPFFSRLYASLENCVIDIHDEGKMKATFGPLVNASIGLARLTMKDLATSLEELEEQVARGETSSLSVVLSLVLDYASFDTFHAEDPGRALQTSPYAGVIRRCRRNIEIARTTDSEEERYTQLNQIVLACWPFIREMIGPASPDSPSGQEGQREPEKAGQNGAGERQGAEKEEENREAGPADPAVSRAPGSRDPDQAPVFSPEAMRKLLDSVAQAQRHAAQTAAPAARGSSQAAKSCGGMAGSVQSPGNGTGDRDAGAAALGGLLREMARDLAEEAMEEKLQADLTDRTAAVAQNSLHDGVPVTVNRAAKVSAQDRENYRRLYEQIRDTSGRLQKQMLEVLRDRKSGATQHHRQYGRGIDAGQTYRLDERYYRAKKAPEDLPDMAVAVLVDNSGSMAGERIQAASLATVLLHDFCQALQIPAQIAGHHTQGHSVVYDVFTDYDSVGEKDRYRLAQMEAEGCNRDGCAIEIAASQLEKRPEERKLLLILSDGQPNHYGYCGEEAAKDIRETVARYKRKGLRIFAASIGSDKEMIEAIYREGFLDISDLSLLPKALVRLVKRYILQ